MGAERDAARDRKSDPPEPVFSVTTDYLLLDEVECPTANENKCTSAGLGMWVSSRGWLLGVGLVVLGVWLLLGLTRGDALP